MAEKKFGGSNKKSLPGKEAGNRKKPVLKKDNEIKEKTLAKRSSLDIKSVPANGRMAKALRQGKPDTRRNDEVRSASRCPYFKKCGACQMIDTPYDKQLRQKHAHVKELLEPYTKVASKHLGNFSRIASFPSFNSFSASERACFCFSGVS